MAFLHEFRRGVARFRRDESGQSLIFASITFFALVVVALLIYGVGEATSAQMELQNAADTAAYAGAQVMADSVAQIAWLNEAMAEVYYTGMRHAVDNAALGTLSAFKEHQPYYGSIQEWENLDESGEDWRALLTPTDAQIGFDPGGGESIESLYAAAHERADDWIPVCEAWLKRLSRLQRGIAVLAPEAVKCQVAYTALQNGAERFAFYPGFTLIPEEPAKRECRIGKIDTPSQYGWTVWSDTDGYEFLALHEPPDREPPVLLDRYLADGRPGSDGKADTVLDTWDITSAQDGKDTVHMEVKAYYPCDENGGNRKEIPAQYRIETQVGAETHLDFVRVISRKEIYHYRDGEETHLVVDEDDDGTTWTINDAKIRQLQDGTRQKWVDDDHDGVVDEDEWVDMPETTTIDGVEVPIDYKSGGGASVQVVYPIRITMQKAAITLVEPVHIAYHTPVGTVHVRDEAASINGRSTNHPSDQWERRHWGHNRGYGDRDDRTYHRLTEVLPDEEWLYEWMRLGAYMEDMDMERFALHAVMDCDPYYDAHVRSADRMKSPQQLDAPDDPPATTPQPAWAAFPRWSRPERIEEAREEVAAGEVTYYEADYGGWFDIAAGEPVKHDGAYTAFSRTIPCWFCGPGGHVEKLRLDGRERVLPDATFDLYETKADPEHIADTIRARGCARPAGFWHEDWSDVDQARRSDVVQAYRSLAGGASWVAVEIPDGRIQVACPCCGRLQSLLGVSGGDEGPRREWVKGPPFHRDDLPVAEKRSFVRKYLCHALGRYSESTPADPFDRAITPEDRVSVQTALRHDTEAWQPPLALTAEFFRKGLTVGTWRSTAGSRIFDQLGGRGGDQKHAGIRNPFPTERERNPFSRGHDAWSHSNAEERSRWMWGHFGLATARLVFWDNTLAAPGPSIAFAWADEDEGAPGGLRPDWIEETHEEIDPLLRPVHWDRQRWLRGPLNLFDPEWDARIVSARRSIDLHDIYTQEDFDEGRVTESGLSFLLDELTGEPWFDDIVDLHRDRHAYNSRNPEWAVMRNFRHMSAPPMQKGNKGRPVDYDDPGIEDVLRH